MGTTGRGQWGHGGHRVTPNHRPLPQWNDAHTGSSACTQTINPHSRCIRRSSNPSARVVHALRPPQYLISLRSQHRASISDLLCSLVHVPLVCPARSSAHPPQVTPKPSPRNHSANIYSHDHCGASQTPPSCIHAWLWNILRYRMHIIRAA